MRRLPKIGDRVRYVGAIHVGPCVGTVVAIYPEFEEGADGRLTGRYLPESSWHVGVRVDAVPVPWCYEGDRFAPALSMLRAA